jgi:hypothetical protein
LTGWVRHPIILQLPPLTRAAACVIVGLGLAASVTEWTVIPR